MTHPDNWRDMDPAELRRLSRERIRQERNGDPNWAYLGDGFFALHVQFGGNAVVVRVQGGDPPGSEDVAAFREWLSHHWPQGSFEARMAANTAVSADPNG